MTVTVDGENVRMNQREYNDLMHKIMAMEETDAFLRGRIVDLECELEQTENVWKRVLERLGE